MKVKLLADILENGTVKTAVSMNKRRVVAYFKGAVVEVSEATGKKWIDAKQAEAVEEVSQA